MIAAHDLTFARRGKKLIHSVNLTLQAGCFTVIIGPNGAGKSTLLKLLSGDMPPDSGHVTYHGQDLRRIEPLQLARKRAVLPQSSILSFPFTALEVVRMGAIAFGAQNPHAAAAEALARLGMQGFESRSYNALSGGEQQRVQFARALAQVPKPVHKDQPCALFLDEPTASLDLGHQISVLETARKFAREGGVVLAILHDLNLAAEFADQILLLQSGHILAQGPAKEVICNHLIERVYGLQGTVGVLTDGLPYVLPQMRHA